MGDRGVSENIVIRRAEPKDIPFIIRIGKEAFPYIQDPDNFFRERYHRSNIFVAEKGGTVIGFVDVEVDRNKAKLAGIAVDTNHRGEGIGTELMKYVLNWLGSINVIAVSLITKRDNVTAKRIYEKFGFIKIKEDDDIETYLLVLRSDRKV